MDKKYFRIKILDNKEDIGYLLVAHGDYCFLKSSYRASIFTIKTFNSNYIQMILKDLKYDYVIEYCSENKINRGYLFR